MQRSRTPRIRRAIIGALALVLAGGGFVGVRFAFATLAGDFQPAAIKAPPGKFPALPAPDTKGMSDKQVKLVRRGQYLTAAGDCVGCHTAPGQKPLAGGFSFATPFGVLYSTNLTPDKQTGIGRWTEKQFWAAMHDGDAPGSSLLVFPNYEFPAMPYTAYAKLSRHDVDAMFAYLKAIPAVDHQPPANDIHFPFNIRAGLLTWRLLYFSAGPMHYKKDWSPAVRHGAYLVEALGHCTDCHSPRNFMFAVKHNKSLAGNRIMGETWYAGNISSSKKYGVGGWKRSTLVAYLHDGGDLTQGADFGPMKTIYKYSLSQLPKQDIEDMAAYLQTATPPRESGSAPSTASQADLARGKKLYAENCALCHGDKGEGVKDVFSNLAGTQAVWEGPPDDLIGVMLAGAEPWHPNGPEMPAFDDTLDDQQIADIANYVRTAWGNPGAADATAKHVRAMRETAPPHHVALADGDYLDLSPGASIASRRLGCPMQTEMIHWLSPGPGWTGTMQDAGHGPVAKRTRSLIAALKQSTPEITDKQIVKMAVTAYCPVVANKAGMSESAKERSLAAFRQNVSAMLAKSGKAKSSAGKTSGS